MRHWSSKPHISELFLNTHIEGITNTPRIQFQPASQLALGSEVICLSPPSLSQIYTHTLLLPRKRWVTSDPKKAKCHKTAVSSTHSLLSVFSARFPLSSPQMETSASTSGFGLANVTVSYSQLKWYKVLPDVMAMTTSLPLGIKQIVFQLQASCWKLTHSPNKVIRY